MIASQGRHTRGGYSPGRFKRVLALYVWVAFGSVLLGGLGWAQVVPLQPPPQQPAPAQSVPGQLSQNQPLPLPPQPGQQQPEQPQAIQPSALQPGNASNPTTPAAPSQSPGVSDANLPAIPTGSGDPAAPPVAATTVSRATTLKENATQRIEQLKADTERAPEASDALAKLYQQILVDAGAVEQLATQRATWTGRVNAAPQSLDAAKLQKEKLKDAVSPQVQLFMSFEEGQARREQLEAELATATNEKNRLSEQIISREKRRKELPQLISDAKARQAQLAKAPEATETDPLKQEALGWSATASKLMAEEQVGALESEQRAYESEATLLPLQLEIAQTIEKQVQENLAIVTRDLEQMRQDRILSKRAKVYDLVKKLPAEMQARGKEVLDRIQGWLELSSKQAEINQEIESSKAILARWNEQRDKMETRVNPKLGTADASGFNSWVGLTLRKQRGELPNPAALASRLRHYQSEMQIADSLLFELEDELFAIRKQLDNLARIEQTQSDPFSPVAEIDSSFEDPELKLTRELLSEAENILNEMKLDVDDYLFDLYQVADIKEQTVLLSDEYRSMIDEHVLWIRSSDRFQASDFKPCVDAFRWLISAENWRDLLQLLWRDMTTKFWWVGLFLICFAILLFNQTRLRRNLSQLGAKAEKRNCADYSITSQSFLLTTVLAIPVPLLLLFLQWRLTSGLEDSSFAVESSEFIKSIAFGLLMTAAVFFPTELLRQLCRVDGLGIKHFEWDKQVARLLASNLRWLLDLGIPLVAVVCILSGQSDPRWESSLGRVAFIILMIMLSIFLSRVFMPTTGVLSQYIKDKPGGWLDRLRYVWYSALVVGPLVLAALSYSGYHYTGMRFAAHLSESLWSIVLLVVTYCMAKRWVMLNRRKLMNTMARQRLEEAAKRETEKEQGGTALAAFAPEKIELNLADMGEQSRRLLTSFVVTAGLLLGYMIWSDILPAVSFLENVELWSVGGSTADDRVRITLANLVLVIPIVVLVFVAARNVPGLLEIVFLQHLPLTTAARYAITTLTRYVIVGGGIVLTSSTLGLQWSSIQWLVAALGVGLGFGLQEIFANFVSGVILLFEQPIRVGDIITVDGTTGTVLKIRMRATTILNWDRQELIVPNKDLVTGKLLNWTLTDSTNRIVVNVGVAYGSDTIRACEIVRDICEQHPNIMRDPKALVTFEGFGDNTLNIVLRAYLATLDNRLPTIHELHQQIYSAFGKAGIEIAFPQRDLHIRSLPDQLQQWLSGQAKMQPARSTEKVNSYDD